MARSGVSLLGETTTSGPLAPPARVDARRRQRAFVRAPIALSAVWLDLANGRVHYKADQDVRTLSVPQRVVLGLLLGRTGAELSVAEVAAAADVPVDGVHRFVYQLQSLIERDPLDPDHLLDTEDGWRFVTEPELCRSSDLGPVSPVPSALAAEPILDEPPPVAPDARPVAEVAPPPEPPPAEVARHDALRGVECALTGDVAGAEQAFSSALAHGGPQVRSWYALHLTLTRQPERALALLAELPAPDPIAEALYAVLRRGPPPQEGEEAGLLWRALEAWRAFASLSRVAADLGDRPFVTVRMVLAARR